MGTTIREVAKQAGVSISTVSRVLNNTCPVDADKQRAVEKAALDLGYTPHPAARSLLSKKSGGLGILLPFVSGEFFSEFLSGIDEYAQKEGFFVLISTSHYSSEDFSRALKGMYGRVDGLLIMAPSVKPAEIKSSELRNIPTVFVNTKTENKLTDSVTFDNYSGMYAMTAHLLSKGHRRIGFVRGPADTFDAEERLRGFLQALSDTGVEVQSDFVVQGGYTLRDGHHAAQKLIKNGRSPTAIMASNDYAALGVMHALREEGVSIPSQVAVTGFDDVPSANYGTPPLSTVHVPVREMGSIATELAVNRIGKGSAQPPQRRTLPVQLVIRESSG